MATKYDELLLRMGALEKTIVKLKLLAIEMNRAEAYHCRPLEMARDLEMNLICKVVKMCGRVNTSMIALTSVMETEYESMQDNPES